MNTPMFQKVVAKILDQAACPRCGAHLRGADYDTLSLNEERLLIELDCHQCESVLTLEGIFKRDEAKETLPKVVVSPETVQAVGQALRSFRGQDIKDLLQK